MTAGAKGIKAGRAFVELGVHDKVQAGLRRAQRRLKAFGAAVSSVGAGMMKIGALAVAPLVASARVFASMGDNIAKMAKRTGFGVKALSTLQFAASQSGTSIEALEKGVKRMATTIFDAGRGLSTAVDALSALGLKYDDLKGLAPEDQFKLLAERLSKVGDATTRAAVASMIFGRAGTAMLPMMAKGAKGIEDLQKKARALGLELSTEDAEAAEKFTDDMDIMGKVVKMAAFKVGAALVPALTKAVKWITETSRWVGEWIKKNRELVVGLLKWAARLMAVGAAMIVVGKTAAVIGGVVTALRGAVVAAKALGIAFTFLALHPVVAVLGAIALAGTAVVWAMRGARDEVEQLREEYQTLAEVARWRERQEKAAARAKAAPAAKKAAEKEAWAKDIAGQRRMEAQIRDQELQRIEDVYDRQVHRIYDRYAEERRKAKGHQLWLMGIERAEAAALETVRVAYQRRKAQQDAEVQRRVIEEMDRAMQEAADEEYRRKEAIGAADLARTRGIEELKLRLTKKGHELEMALLELRRKRAIETAREAGINLDLVRKEFDLRKKILEGARAGVAKAAAAVTGTFSARALWGLGGGKAADRTAKATEETAKNTKKILGRRTTGEPVFY